MRRGVRVGIDVGSVRIGVARSDIDGAIAVSETTVPRGPGDLASLVTLIAELEASEVVVGLPLSLDGSEGRAASDARSLAVQLADAVRVPVRLVDERFTTTEAHKRLAAGGGRAGTERGRRQIVDQVAAAILLQHALDAERGTGLPPGEVVPSTASTTGEGDQ